MLASFLSLRRDKVLVSDLRRIIREYSERFKDTLVKIMNFCGTHEWTTVNFGIRSLMPANVQLVAGPGCPVCITPSYYIEESIRLSLDGVRVYCFGDVFKLPAIREVRGAKSLEDAKACGGDVKVVYSFLDAIKDARDYGKDSVFLGIGFETTAPSYAVPMVKGHVPRNLLLLSVLRLTPPAARYALENTVKRGAAPVQGIIAPGHVSTVIGAKPWSDIAEEFRVPTVVSGFEPLDVLLSIALILQMRARNTVKTVIEYSRLVTWEGNRYAQRAIYEVFEKTDAAWRGLGFIPESGLELRGKYRKYDALHELGLKELTRERWAYDLLPGCKCSEITLGLAKPSDCKYFMKACTPERPLGPCMVSLEGTCAIWGRFGGGGIAEEVARDIGLEGGW
ncbi:MAG: hydrogenase formation protein HypD [Thermoprotei archaeon]|nr:MAG: hydrogenase formation protein HypD [Thermoprotei archaeon]